MSLHAEPAGPVPEETARVARAAFPKGNVYLQMRDVLGVIYDDETFSPLFAARGRPAESPWRLALVTVMQFAEGLSDRQAAEVVRARIDWKYALGLALEDSGFHYSVLREFRCTLARRESGPPAAWGSPGSLPDAWLAAPARTAAHRLNPRSGGAATPQSPGTGRRDDAGGTGRSRRRGARLAPGPHAA